MAYKTTPAQREASRKYYKEYYKAHSAEERARQKEYRKAHAAEISAHKKEYRKAHAAELREANRKYYKAHAAELREASREYWRAHAAELAAGRKERRAKDPAYRAKEAERRANWDRANPERKKAQSAKKIWVEKQLRALARETGLLTQLNAEWEISHGE